jgi:hypothetical protein
MQVKHETHRTPCALSDIISKFGLHLGRLHVKLATGDPASKHRSSSCGAQSVANGGSAHRGRIMIADTAQPTKGEGIILNAIAWITDHSVGRGGGAPIIAPEVHYRKRKRSVDHFLVSRSRIAFFRGTSDCGPLVCYFIHPGAENRAKRRRIVDLKPTTCVAGTQGSKFCHKTLSRRTTSARAREDWPRTDSVAIKSEPASTGRRINEIRARPCMGCRVCALWGGVRRDVDIDRFLARCHCHYRCGTVKSEYRTYLLERLP